MGYGFYCLVNGDDCPGVFYITGHWLGLVVWPRNAVSLCLNGTDLGMIYGDRGLLFQGVLQDFALRCVVLV